MKNTNHENPQKQKNPLFKLSIVLSCCALIILVGVFVLLPKLSQENGPTVGMPNPLKQVLTLKEANALTGFTAKIPGVFPFEVERQKYFVIGNETTQVIFENATGLELIYRMSSSKKDISGVYNKFAVTENVTIDTVKVKLKGDAKDQYFLATWNDGTYSYSMYSTLAISLDDFSSFFKSIH